MKVNFCHSGKRLHRIVDTSIISIEINYAVKILFFFPVKLLSTILNNIILDIVYPFDMYKGTNTLYVDHFYKFDFLYNMTSSIISFFVVIYPFFFFWTFTYYKLVYFISFNNSFSRDLSDNQIGTLNSDMFSGLPNLEKL